MLAAGYHKPIIMIYNDQAPDPAPTLANLFYLDYFRRVKQPDELFWKLLTYKDEHMLREGAMLCNKQMHMFPYLFLNNRVVVMNSHLQSNLGIQLKAFLSTQLPLSHCSEGISVHDSPISVLF